jgi:hypothetical protein
MADQNEEELEKTPVEPTTAIPTASDMHLEQGGESSAQPSRLYIPACGVLCDAFWWAGSKTK